MVCNKSNLEYTENETSHVKSNYYEKDLNCLYSINSIQLVSLHLQLAWRETISQIFKSFQLMDNNNNIISSSDISISNANFESIIVKYDLILKKQYNDDIKLNNNIINSNISNKTYIEDNSNNNNNENISITPLPPVLPKSQVKSRPGRKLYIES